MGEGGAGGGKKLITFSLYGANPKYVNGAVKNAQMLGKVFPGWQARFYTDLGTVPAHIQSALLAAGAEIYPIDMAKYGSQSMFWRFWAAADKDVERFISRDVDSRLMERDAVPQHGQSGRLGGATAGHHGLLRVDRKARGCSTLAGEEA